MSGGTVFHVCDIADSFWQGDIDRNDYVDALTISNAKALIDQTEQKIVDLDTQMRRLGNLRDTVRARIEGQIGLRP